MHLNYLHLRPNEAPPILVSRPFRAVMIAELTADQSWRSNVASWLVDSGCLYFIAWGEDCESWHDAVDWAVLEDFNFGDIPDDRLVITTWHDKEPLTEALWFAGNSASHPDVDLQETVIVHIAPEDQRAAMLQRFYGSQALANDS